MFENNLQQKCSGILKELKKSLLFNLSLSSKELFHSNFIAWCCDTWKRQMFELWVELLPILTSEIGCTEIKKVNREHNHHDIEIIFDNNSMLVIELKVKSIPIMSQLEKYLKQSINDNSIIALVSIKCPDNFENNKHVFDDGSVCYWIDLNLIAKKMLEKCCDIDNHYYEIFNDYKLMINNMKELLNLISIDWKSIDNQRFFLEGALEEELRGCRIHDIVLKHRYDELCVKLTEELNAKKTSWFNGEQGQLLGESGMTNSTGLMSIGYMISGKNDPWRCPVVVGIQFQDRQFRQFLYVGSDREKEIGNLVYDIAKCMQEEQIWFNLDIMKNISDPMKSERKRDHDKFCCFGKLFYYKYNKLYENILLKDIIENFKDLIINFRNNTKKHERIVDIIKEYDINNIIYNSRAF